MIRRSGAILAAAWLVAVAPIGAQDTTQAYPWRQSHFPYVTASPNDGVMAMGRVVFFRQARWDDRVSLHSGAAIEGGYSTNDSWLIRARGDFPRLADGWRLQAIAQAQHSEGFLADRDPAVPGSRQSLSVEVSRVITGPYLLAFRGEAAHLAINALRETHMQGRIALIMDRRDREYDTHRGMLMQGGLIIGRGRHEYLGAGLDGGALKIDGVNYTGWYGLASGWLPFGEATRVTARVGARLLSSGAEMNKDSRRIMPAWEDGFVVLGGPESNRALPIAAGLEPKVLLSSVELRQDLFTFPGGAIAALAFVDGGRSYCNGCHATVTVRVDNGATRPEYAVAMTGEKLSDTWFFGPGVGVAVRLLRNAVLTVTAARGEGRIRWYVSSGWSW